MKFSQFQIHDLAIAHGLCNTVQVTRVHTIGHNITMILSLAVTIQLYPICSRLTLSSLFFRDHVTRTLTVTQFTSCKLLNL